jgi:hypothetical protein
MQNSSPGEPQAKPTFVFKGTIRKLRASTMQNVPIDDRTAVVHVDQVVEAPQNLAQLAGKDITIRMADHAKSGVGQQFLFHAASWIFGESVALRAIAQEPVQGAHAALLARTGDPAAQRATRELKQRVNDADLVVYGTVKAVRLPSPEQPLKRAVSTAVPAVTKPVSEHDPKWREAVVDVASVHKGEHAPDEVTVLFPSSHDVMWYKAPKFEPGRKGYFILHKTQVKEAERVGAHMRALLQPAAAEKPVEVYTALSPTDFQPSTNADQLTAALGEPLEIAGG